MEPIQMAVVWTMLAMQEPQPRRIEPAKQRRSFATRLGGQLRRIAFRAQLGPIGGQAPA